MHAVKSPKEVGPNRVVGLFDAGTGAISRAGSVVDKNVEAAVSALSKSDKGFHFRLNGDVAMAEVASAARINDEAESLFAAGVVDVGNDDATTIGSEKQRFGTAGAWAAGAGDDGDFVSKVHTREPTYSTANLIKEPVAPEHSQKVAAIGGGR